MEKYNFDYCKQTINDINEALNNKNLIILCGEAGTGKSSLIKYMINNNLFNLDSKEILYVSYYNEKIIKEDLNSHKKLVIIDNYDFINSIDRFNEFIAIKNILEKTKVLLIQRNTIIEYDYDCAVINMPLLNINSIKDIMMGKDFNYHQFIKYGLNETKLLEITNGSILLLDLLNNYLKSNYEDSVVRDLLYVLSEKDNEYVTQLLYVTALKYYINNNFEQAEELFFHIVNIDLDKTITVQSLYRISEIKEKEKKYDEAIFILKQILKKLNNNFETAKIYNRIGELYRKTNSNKLALESFEFALSTITNTKNNNTEYNNLMIELLINISSIFSVLGEYNKAIHNLEKALEKNSENNEELLMYYKTVIFNNLASIYAKSNKLEKANLYYNQALNILNSSAPSLHNKQLNSLINNNIRKITKDN